MLIDFPIPTEYIINCQIKDKLANVELTRYLDDTLFYLFYMSCGDLMQLQAAAVLYDRDWRYHVEKRFWLTKVPGVEPQQKTTSFEKGFYTVFDAIQWRKIQTELTIEYCKLAEKPQLPAQFQLHQQQQLNSNSSSVSTPATSILPAVFHQQLMHQQSFGNSGSVTPAAGSLSANPTSASSF